MKASNYLLPACCGVQVIGGFGGGDDIATLTEHSWNKSGTGYYISTFTRHQKRAYDEMCEHFDLVCQTEPKRNRNSDNQVFIAIFKEKA